MHRTSRVASGVAALALAGSAPASDVISWTSDLGQWEDAANWDLGVVPTLESTYAVINNGGHATLNTDAGVYTLVVGADGSTLNGMAGSGIVSHGTGFLRTGNVLVGVSGGNSGIYANRGPAILDADEGMRLGEDGVGELIVEPGGLVRVAGLFASSRRRTDGPGPDASHSTISVLGSDTVVLVQDSQPGFGGGELLAGAWGSTELTVRSGQLRADVASLHTSAADGSSYTVEDGGLIRAGTLTLGRALGIDDNAEVGPATLSVWDGSAVQVSGLMHLLPDAVLRGTGYVRAERFIVSEGVRLIPIGESIEGGGLVLDGLLDMTGATPSAHGPAEIRVLLLSPDIHTPMSVRAAEGLRGRLGADRPNHDPEVGDRFTIIGMTAQRILVGDEVADVGRFTELDLPDLGPGKVLRPAYSLERVELVVACPADLNLDESVDLDDIDAFVAEFTRGDPVADLTLDGVINFDDIDAFVESFLNGC